MQEPSRQRIELILQQMDQLPTLPAIAVRVLEVGASDSSSVKDICRVIESDPALATRILQLVHRSDLGISGDVNTLDRAVLLLGFEAVRCAVLAVSVFATFNPGTNDQGKFSRTEFWKHSIAVGCCTELLAGEIVVNWGRAAGIDPAEAFLAGLLHDIGKLALDSAVPKSFARAVEAADMMHGNIADIERSVIGMDHMVVGKRLAEQWSLPANLRDAIWLHGQMPQALPASVRNGRLVNLVTLADMIVREQRIGYSGNYTFPIQRQTMLDSLGLLPQQVEKVSGALINAVEERAKALGLGSAEAQDLYRQALQQAHRELSRMSDQLASRNRKLSTRAKYFEAVAAFQSELRPDAPPGVVLHAIGQTAAGVLDASVAAVVSLPPNGGYAEVVLVDRSGQIVQSHLLEQSDFETTALPVMRIPARPQPGSGPVTVVGQDLEWLVQAFSPRFAGPQRFWICLEADGECIGAVVWSAEAAEIQRLASQAEELTALTCGWSLALRTSQIRDEARTLSEQLAEANRRLQTAQNEIYRTRMLTSVAEMAAGAAHEMNNPLAVISGRSQLLASALSDPRQRDSAKLIHEKSQQLSDIITELMMFAKPLTPKPQIFDVARLFQTALEQAKGRTNIADRQIETRVGELPFVNIDLQQVGSAMAEIVINAIEATDPATGRLTFSGSFDAFSQKLVLTVTDNGSGMSDTVLRHAFDPFFSAKQAGRQHGMGLAKALRWIESAGGSLRLESRPNAGTRAIIILPAVMEATERSPSWTKQAT